MSEAFEAQSASEFGGQIQLAGTVRTNPTVTVLMSSWGCQSGHWYSEDCSTTPGATFSEPITLNVYSVGSGGAVGTLLTSDTQTFNIPYRPSADNTNCTGPNAGEWYSASDSTCYNGFATPISFSLTGVTLPDTVIASVAYNTTHYGYQPYGEGTTCFGSSAGCGYDSLNVGLANALTVGTDPQPSDAYLNSSWGGAYCDSGASGTGTFRLDSGCWTGYQPAIKVSASAACTPTGFYRDGINLTAAQIGGSVSGTLDASGCNIGVYYGPGTSGTVNGAEIYGANYYGVVDNGAAVNVTGSSIHNIGEVPFNGAQHGNAVYFTNAASGTISGNTVSHYQKNGITAVNRSFVTISGNNVTGEGPVDYIAQNGIEVGSGTSATVSGNNVSGNAYSGTNNASSGGILVFGGPCFGVGVPYTTGVSVTSNTLTNNDVGIYLYNAAAGCTTTSPTKTQNKAVNNIITNSNETNISGNGSTGYQAGISDFGNKDSIVNNTISGNGYATEGDDPPGTIYTKIDSSGSQAAHIKNNS